MNVSKILTGIVLCLAPGIAAAQAPGASLEKFTGAWCGWCPYGAWVLDSIEARLGDRAVVLAWHFDDKLEIKAHDTLSAKISNGGHPVVSIARKPVISNSELDWSESHPWYLKTLEQLAIDPLASGTLDHIQYDPSTRALIFLPALVPVVSEWPTASVPMTVAVLTEDDVMLDQSLYAKNGSLLPKLIDYPHKNVVRQVAGKVLGDSMNYAFGAGWFFLPYQMTVDPKSDASKTRLNVLFLVRNEDGSYTPLGAIRTKYLTELNTASVERGEQIDIAIYPNPASEKITLTLPLHRNALLELYNALGQQVMMRDVNNDRLELEVRELPPGIYTLRIVINENIVVRQVVVH